MDLSNKQINLHIGCGFKVGKNWTNYDSSPIAIFDKIPILRTLNKLNNRKFPNEIRYGNIVKRLFCEENTADNIYCSHVLEHVSLNDGKKMLRNIYEMLKPNGIFRIVVPSLETRINRYNKFKDANLFMESLGCVNKDENNSILKKIRFLFGGARHKWMYDKNSLLEELKISGFKKIRECKYNDSGLDIFKEVENKDRFEENNGELKAIAFHCIK